MKHVSMQINTNSGQSVRIYKDPRKDEIVVEETQHGTIKYTEINRVPIGKRGLDRALDTVMRVLVPQLTFATTEDDDGRDGTGGVPAKSKA